MKIMIINPDYGMTLDEMNQRCVYLKNFVDKDTELHMECLQNNRVYIDSMLDVVLAGAEIVQMAKKAQDDGFDAVVLYCFSDPTISACKEVLDIPVVGGGQASYLSALMVSRQFGVILSEGTRIAEKKLFAYETGVDINRVADIKAVDLQGRKIREDIDFTMEQIVKTGKAMMDNQAQALILGCLSFLGMAEPVSNALGIPVIDSAVAAVTMAELLVKQNLRSSKKSYPLPPKGERTWDKGSFII